MRQKTFFSFYLILMMGFIFIFSSSCEKEDTDNNVNNTGIPVLSTIAVTDIAETTAKSGGNISSEGGSAITARGVVWSTSQNPSLESNQGITNNGTGVGAFTSSLSGLINEHMYYVRAYATNSSGTAYGSQVSFTTSTLVIGEVYNPTTGETWMDRNLGASQVATSSIDEDAYGDLYQWGRDADGHQILTSATTSTLSSTDDPSHGDFILSSSGTNDWRSPQNANLWQGVNGTNNPCPSGFRIPTEEEWNAERESWAIQSPAGAFASPLKLTVAGYRYHTNGVLGSAGASGSYWSSTVEGTDSRYLYFRTGTAEMRSNVRGAGFSVRCIKD